MRADLAAGDGAERDGIVGRTEARRPDFGNTGAAGLGHDGKAVDVGGLALVGGHAEGGVALQVLDRLEALALGQAHVLSRHVVLQVDELLAAPLDGRHLPERQHCSVFRLPALDRGLRQGRGAEAGVTGCRCTRFSTGRKAGRQAEVAVAGTGRAPSLLRLTRHEGLDVVAEVRPAAGMACQVNGRRPAPGHGQGVGHDPTRRALQTFGVRIVRRDMDALQRLPAFRLGHHVAREMLDAARSQRLDKRLRRCRPGIDESPDRHALVGQPQRRVIGAVVVGEEDDLAAGSDAEAQGIAAHRIAQHDSRRVVAVEDDRPLDGAAGDHHLLGPDGPVALPWRVLRRYRHVVRDPLDGGQHVVVEIAVDARARHEGDVVEGRELCDRSLGPVSCADAVEGLALVRQHAAELRHLLGQNDAGAAYRRGPRRHQAGRPAADHQNVAVRVQALVAARDGLQAASTQTRCAPDEVLVDHPGLSGRPHEGLVVEASRQEVAEQAVDRQHVEAERGPTVLAGRLQPVVELHHGRLGVGLDPRAAAHGDQGTRLLGSGGEHTAGPMILEAAAEQSLFVGQQGRSQGVAGEAAQIAAIETEADTPAAVDLAAAGGQTVAAHHSAPTGSLTRSRSALPVSEALSVGGLLGG